MFSADDLLDVLRRRRTLKSIRPEEPGRLPPGWERWLAAMPVHAGAVTGAPPGAWVDAFAGRPLRAPPRAGAPLTRWQAFGTLWQQQWQEAPREERGLRVFAMAASLVVHACFAVLLAWLMYLHLLVLLQAPEAPAGEGHVVQVEYIGTGTPDTPGGGQAPPVPEPEDQRPPRAAAAPAPDPSPSTDAPAPASPDAPALPDLPVEVAVPTVAATVPPVPRREIPVPAPAAQPLQVTEVERPDIAFVLPPPTVRVEPLVREELQVPTRDIPEPEVVEAIEADLPTGLPAIAVEAPDAARPVLAGPRREVPATAVAATAAAPEPAPAPAAGDSPDAAAGESRTAASDAADDAAEGREAAGIDDEDGTTDALAGEGVPATAGAGPATAVLPGGWPSPSRGDDWDDALRNRPGGRAGEAGALDGAGRDGLASATGGGPPGGAPPGSAAREAIDLEKAGTWLRRPPLDYRPTRFDRFWVPSGTLLEEWVRRGVKQVAIPIPGTSKEIVCVVSILQLGGGCGLRDPNLNEEPSTGRAAPEVPFKPELQEDRDALARPPGG